MLSRTTVLLVTTSLAVGACSEGGNPPSTSSAGAETASQAASATATASASAAPQEPATDFGVVAQADGGITVYPLQGSAMVDAAGILTRLSDGPFQQDPAHSKGLLKSAIGQFYGILPGGAWFFPAAPEEGSPTSYRWIKDQWGPVALLREGESILDIAAWDEERAIAAIAMPSNDIRFFLVGGKPGAILPAPMGAKSAPSENEGEEDRSCKVQMSPTATYKLSGLPSGHLFAAGLECTESGSGRPMVERWEPKKARGIVDPLPGAKDRMTISGVVARAPDDAYVWGSSVSSLYWAHYDGKEWKEEKAPFEKTPLNIVATPDGTLWAVGLSGVYKQPKGGEWKKLTFPTPGGATLEPTSIWARSADKAWVAARAGNTAYLLTQKPEGPAVTLPSRGETEKSLQFNRRWPASPVCVKPYALLATVGRKGDKVPGDFPSIREVFAGKPEAAGVKFVLENDGANYYVGAQAPSTDAAKKLIELYLAKNPKATAAVFCHDPVIVEREIPM